jgi:hypothetical protein
LVAHKGDAGFSAGDLRSDLAKTNLATPPPSRLETSPFRNRPLAAKQPSEAEDSLGSEEIEILESPSTVRVSLIESFERGRNDGDYSEGLAETATVTQVVPAHTEDDIGVKDQ